MKHRRETDTHNVRSAGVGFMHHIADGRKLFKSFWFLFWGLGFLLISTFCLIYATQHFLSNKKSFNAKSNDRRDLHKHLFFSKVMPFAIHWTNIISIGNLLADNVNKTHFFHSSSACEPVNQKKTQMQKQSFFSLRKSNTFTLLLETIEHKNTLKFTVRAIIMNKDSRFDFEGAIDSTWYLHANWQPHTDIACDGIGLSNT